MTSTVLQERNTVATGSVSSLSLAYTSNVTAGSAQHAISVGGGNSNSTAHYTDNLNTWPSGLLDWQFMPSANQFFCHQVNQNCAGGATTVTFNLATATPNGNGLWIREIGGASATANPDGHVLAYSLSTTSLVANATNTVNPALVSVVTYNGNNAFNATLDGSYTASPLNPSWSAIFSSASAGFKRVVTSASQSLTATQGTADEVAAVMAIFDEAPAAPTGSAAITEPHDTVTASGSVGSSITGTGSPTEAHDTVAGTGAAVAAPTITSVNSGSAIAEGQTGVALVGTGMGAANANRTFALVQGSVSVAQTETGTGTATAATLTIVTESTTSLKFGSATMRVTRTADGGIGTIGVTVNPPTGLIFVDVGTPDPTAADSITASGAITSGDQIEARAVGGGAAPTGLSLNSDCTFAFSSGNTPTPFDVRVWDHTDFTWGGWATQTLFVGVGAANEASDVAAGSGTASTTITGSAAIAEPHDTAAGAGGGNIPATGAAAEAHDVANATTAVTDSGSGSPAEPHDVVAGAGAATDGGSGAIAEPHDAVNAAGGNTDGGSAAIPEPADTVSGAGSVGGVDNGSGAIVEPSDVVTASGGATDSATGAAQESPDVVNASGTPTDPGSGAPLEQPDTVAGAGIVGGGGVGNVIEPPDTVAASGTATDSGSGSAQDGADQVNASGTPTDTGSGASAEAHDSVAASGAAGPGGTGGPVEPPDTASGAGTSTDTGAGASAENPDAVSAAGQTATSGSAAAGESHDVVTAAGTVRQPGFSFPRGAVIVVEFDFFSERLIPTAPDDRRITIGAS